MAKSGSQTEKGKAFEYACAESIRERMMHSQLNIELLNSPQLNTAKRCFAYLEAVDQVNYKKGASAAVKIIERLEPNLFNGHGTLSIGLQTDSAGIAGDVRDVVCARDNGWEIGLSCKHNHDAVKHSRLSDTIDFGHDWFSKGCSEQYFDEVGKIFKPLREKRNRSLALDRKKPALWSEIPDKNESCYVPVLLAFMKELKRLDKENPGEIPESLIKYLIGRNDFYKVIMNDNRRYTQIESMNINGTLNKSAGNSRALINVPIMKMPTKFYEIGFKNGSKNTIYVVCDQGWNVSMRIHNASSKIEPSLKFDVQLLAMPSSILTQIEPWED